MNSVEDICKYLLQRQIRVTIDRHKLLRRGQLLLFNIKDHVITLNIKTHKGVIRTYEIFYPFSVKLDKRAKTATLSYDHQDLMINELEAKYLAKKYKAASALFNKNLVIEFE